MIDIVVHFFFAILVTFYAYIFPKSWLDMYYLYMTVLKAIHWTILRGECFVSLMDKWKKDPHYKMGTSPLPSDLIDAFGKNYSGVMKIVWVCFSILKALSFYIVLKRNKIKHSEWFGVIFLSYLFMHINSYFCHLPFLFLFIIILFNLKR